MAGFGRVVRDHCGVIILSFGGPLLNCLAIDMELHALWRGFLEMKGLGVVGVILEGDSKVILSWTSGSRCPWKFLNKVDKIQYSISSYGFSISWVPRAANLAAEELARQGLREF